MRGADHYDVIVVGGGPAGSVMAWALATRGVRVAVIERATFPREKVCGDFVEPGGLRILQAMGCLADLATPLPITATRVYFGPRLAYRGDIPYYQGESGAPPHGYIVPRHLLDTRLLECAAAAGASVHQGCAARSVSREDGWVRVEARDGERDFTLSGRLVIGADGAESMVARSAGLRRTDRRHIGLSQRAYVEGVEVEGGEATIWFDDDLCPGYGWMFPMPGGRANVGIGMLSETCHRHGLSVAKGFSACIEKLRLRHPGCAKVELASRPLGGTVKTYGGIDRNHFDGGLLIGDAGSFVDPMTGEGITQGMESALIGASTVMDALEAGRFDAEFLAQFDRDFRAYFDPAMTFLELCATILRNWHLRDFWLRATWRGFEEASDDRDFARIAGTIFGGQDVRPLAIVEQVWSKIFAYVGKEGALAIGGLLSGRVGFSNRLLSDLSALESGWTRSLKEDPRWHFAWLADLARASARVQPSLWTRSNPRMLGPLA